MRRVGWGWVLILGILKGGFLRGMSSWVVFGA